MATASAGAQAAPDPRVAQPERPTVATHAWTVAPAYVELEAGIELDRNQDGTSALGTPVLLKLGLARRVQLGLQSTLIRPPGTPIGLGDLSVGVKIRLADAFPVLGAFAILPAVKLPVGNAEHGTGTTDGSLLLISSHSLGPVGLDVNFGYTRRSGDSSKAPRSATVWTMAAGFPVRGALGWDAEVFGLPRTAGPAGAAGVVALLGGPTLVLRPSLVFDAGGILHLTGPQPDALYAGLVCNFGRL